MTTTTERMCADCGGKRPVRAPLVHTCFACCARAVTQNARSNGRPANDDEERLDRFAASEGWRWR